VEIQYIKNIKAAQTAHNIRFTLRRSSGLAYEKPQSAYGLRGVFLRHILPALVFASQSPYSGGQNVVNLSRYAT
jgi:hypothetical protein